MAKYRIAWLPGDGVGVDVLDAARTVLNKLALDAEYIRGDIGWEFWREEGDALPARTIDLLRNVDAALFGAVTSRRRGRASYSGGEGPHLRHGGTASTADMAAAIAACL